MAISDVSWLFNALNVNTIQSIFSRLMSPQKQNSGGELNVAPIVSTASMSNLSLSGCVVDVIWTSQTTDGLFGRLLVDGSEVCKACTNLADRIEDGQYTAVIDLSPRLQYRCPHIHVPKRDQAAGGDAGLRLHIANSPTQSLGCIFPGTSIDGDAVDDSTDAFNDLMSRLPQGGRSFQVVISSAIAS
jgi:hypothetical protein